MADLDLVAANLDRREHAEAVVSLVNEYSLDPMGDGRPLPDSVRARLVPGLRSHPTTLVLLAFEGGAACGAAICFRGFNTFAARPVVNVHDLIVAPASRGRGVARALMARVEQEARGLGCSALTLEVRGDNHRALRLYAQLGFRGGRFDPPSSAYAFWTKPLDDPPRSGASPARPSQPSGSLGLAFAAAEASDSAHRRIAPADGTPARTSIRTVVRPSGGRMGILSWIVLGLIVGIVAKWIMPGPDGGGFVLTVLLGIAGAFVGGFIASFLGLGSVTGINPGSLLIATGGALVVLWGHRQLRGRR